MSSTILMPRAIYGDRNTTRKEWAKIARRAWKAGNWDNVVVPSDLVPLDELEGDILLSRFFTSRKEIHWRPYWAYRSAALIMSLQKHSDLRERVADWYLSGMQHVWFTIGMLCYEDGDVWDPDNTSQAIRDYRYELLKRFVRWLPEVCEPAKRYADEMGPPGEMQPYFWISNILRVALHSGWKINTLDWRVQKQVIDNESNGDFCVWLISLGVIERDGARYRLQPRPTDTSHLTWA